MKKSKLIFLLGLMVLMAAFGAIEEDKNAPLRDWFLLSDQKLTTQTWFYFLVEHFIKVMIGWFMWHEIERYNNIFRWWFLISIFNASQYVLKYNSVYFSIGGVNFSSHIIATFIIARAIILERGR